ncbi:uncharacterized protein SEPMUDRAFT_149087 [Sphaerulina musiva SO2202]|uniref:Uncharacterized protein n=1 Tax=Sphaerulina musiva (strain SO2202) TaxID=692275 RepID=M3CF40_SPHMS|nr:uncharacterized protein SEPMUDRAFT_149087 [Sphaerulina musiva SO2202]EMF12398.1 hypothetical protein SEPMUDRAFT_149087 [Sphaerulina musiva SO2202]
MKERIRLSGVRWMRRRRRRGYSLASVQDIYPIASFQTHTVAADNTREEKESATKYSLPNLRAIYLCSIYPSIRSLTRRKKQSRPVCIQDMKSQGYCMYD